MSLRAVPGVIDPRTVFVVSHDYKGVFVPNPLNRIAACRLPFDHVLGLHAIRGPENDRPARIQLIPYPIEVLSGMRRRGYAQSPQAFRHWLSIDAIPGRVDATYRVVAVMSPK